MQTTEETGRIPSAKLSPRVECNGTIAWYNLDTFNLDFEIKLITEDGTQIDLEESDLLQIVFYNSSGDTVYTFSFTEFVDNTVTLEFNQEVTALFEKGRYLYKVLHFRDFRRTIAYENVAIVE